MMLAASALFRVSHDEATRRAWCGKPARTVLCRGAQKWASLPRWCSTCCDCSQPLMGWPGRAQRLKHAR